MPKDCQKPNFFKIHPTSSKILKQTSSLLFLWEPMHEFDWNYPTCPALKLSSSRPWPCEWCRGDLDPLDAFAPSVAKMLVTINTLYRGSLSRHLPLQAKFSSSNGTIMILIHNNSTLKSNNQPTTKQDNFPEFSGENFLQCCSPRSIPPMVTPLVLLPILPLPVGSMPWLLWIAFLAVKAW